MAIFDAALLKRRGLGKRILALLASKHPLPEEGIIAGQSVASAIDELYKLSPPIYNDIDVFLSGVQWQKQTGQPAIVYTKPSTKMLTSGVQYRAERQQSIEAEYARVFIISDRTLYTVRRARTDGLINRVWVDWYDTSYARPELNVEPVAPRAASALATRRAGALITGFDLNSTQVAVDIRSGKLFYTPAFAQFFATRQLNIVCTFTPVQSLLRYLKKRNELECYGNDEAQIELTRRLVRMNEYDQDFRDERINTFLKGRVQFTRKAVKALLHRNGPRYISQAAQRVGTGLEGAPLAFGKKYAGLLDQYGNDLKPFFDTTRHPKKELFLFSSRDDAPPLPDRGTLTSHQTAQPRRFWQLYLPAGKLTTLRRDAFRQFTENLEGAVAQRYESAYITHGDAYLEGAESPSGMGELLVIVKAHDEVSRAIAGVALGSQIEVIRIVRAGLKKAGIPEAWGLFAGKNPFWALKLIRQPDTLNTDIARIKGSEQPVVAALPLPTHAGDVEIVELRSAAALRGEGARMHHCVGGYISEVADHYCRIVSLRGGPSAPECSTFEWVIGSQSQAEPQYAEKFGQNRPLQMKLAQHYSFANKTPPRRLSEVESRLREDLNQWLLDNPKQGYDLLLPEKWTE